MAELFLAMSGSLAQDVVAFYLDNQLLLNVIVVIYGMVLIVGHRNVRTIESILLQRYGGKEWEETLTLFADEKGIMEQIVPAVKLPFMASPYFFSLYRIGKGNIINVIGKKYGVSRTVLRKLTDTTKERQA